MVRLKLFFILVLFYLISNIAVDKYLFGCRGSEIIASKVYSEKIRAARNLFAKPINFPEPRYYIKTTKCYNAWANYRAKTGVYKVILSEPIIRDFSTEELAGILGHELAHIQAFLQKKSPSHWKIDVIGAELTSKNIETRSLNRILKEGDNVFEKNKLLMYAFLFSYIGYGNTRNDLIFRIKKVDDYFK